jgi:hypothetical protein
MNRLEVNATLLLLQRMGLIPTGFAGSPHDADIIAHVYDVCVRNGVSSTAIGRELEALLRERNPQPDVDG